MRKYDPSFDLWQLENEAKEIFLLAYNKYLEGDLDVLEKMCADSALGYFKVLIKKREVE